MPTMGDRVISPLTLDHSWSEVTRLLALWIMTCVALMFNGFFNASFFIDRGLQRRGMVFLACVGASDLLITGIVFPITAVVILSRVWDTDEVCYIIQFIVTASTYSYSIFFSLSVAENYLRLSMQPADHQRLMASLSLYAIIVVVLAVCFVTAGVGVFFGLDFDSCRRAYYGNFGFRIVTDIIFHGIPTMNNIFYLASSVFAVQRRARASAEYRESVQYNVDKDFNMLNIGLFLVYCGSWMPYLLTVYATPEAPDQSFYYAVSIAIMHATFTTLTYGILDPYKRRTFARVFN